MHCACVEVKGCNHFYLVSILLLSYYNSTNCSYFKEKRTDFLSRFKMYLSVCTFARKVQTDEPLKTKRSVNHSQENSSAWTDSATQLGLTWCREKEKGKQSHVNIHLCWSCTVQSPQSCAPLHIHTNPLCSDWRCAPRSPRLNVEERRNGPHHRSRGSFSVEMELFTVCERT